MDLEAIKTKKKIKISNKVFFFLFLYNKQNIVMCFYLLIMHNDFKISLPLKSHL